MGELSTKPGRVGQTALYTSCMKSARHRKVSRLVSSTPATTWSCRNQTEDPTQGAMGLQ